VSEPTQPIPGQLDVYDVIDLLGDEVAQRSGTCGLTGLLHRPVYFRSAWWCRECRTKLETCCEGQPQGEQ
jgi:hypothetical protein